MTKSQELKMISTGCAPEPLEISLRAYVTKEGLKQKRKGKLKQRPDAGPDKWTLIFDTETRIDHAQGLRFGCFQVRQDSNLFRKGLFYEPGNMSEEELTTLGTYATQHGFECMPVRQFVVDILFGIGYDLRAAIVGFNLPFDISRLAISHGAARGPSMRGGFSFCLSQDPNRPRIQIRNLSSRAALIQFAGTRKRQDNRRERQEKNSGPVRRGYFLDLRTIGAALLSRSFSLETLAKALGTKAQKAKVDQHGETLKAEYIDYAVQDVQTTWECYQVLRAKFQSHRLERAHLHKILSEASLGKAYLKQMGITPWIKVQPEFPAFMLGTIMSTYYGGRTEVRIRREIRQVLYCDFLSMYPTVCTLMHLWRFVIAKGISFIDATEKTREFLEKVTSDDLKKPKNWLSLTTLVQVRPEGDVFPVRAKYDGALQATIGLNHITSSDALWYTLADCIASKMLTGRAPHVVRALQFLPKPKQGELTSIAIAGSAEHCVDPFKDDFFCRLIDLRRQVKAQQRKADSETHSRLESQQLALKILANSTSYGIFIELNVEELGEPEDIRCYPSSGEAYDVETKNLERPGTYFHPLLATLITGAARLMLALAEKQTIDRGLEWTFCDTDSMAITRPEGMGQEEFFDRAKQVCDWFDALNPYQEKGPLFKIEEANLKKGTHELEPLFCLAISSKRYVLFNLNGQGLPVIRKASAHGLGHLMAPYETSVVLAEHADAKDLLRSADIAAWQYDLWFHIIVAMRKGHPDQVSLDYHPALRRPAISRYGATTTSLLKLFENFNKSRLYSDQVRPFNFLISLYADPFVSGSHPLGGYSPSTHGKRRKIRDQQTYPIAPFNRDPRSAASQAFDRVRGRPVPIESLKTYARLLAQYHLSPETKFENGKPLDRGLTRRRHVYARSIRSIGKEANRWEEQLFVGGPNDMQIDYGVGVIGQNHQIIELRELAGKVGRREASVITGLSRGTIERLLSTPNSPIGPKTASKLAIGIAKLRAEVISNDNVDREIRAALSSKIEQIGLSPVAAELGLDPSNLRKTANGSRGISVGLRARLRAYIDPDSNSAKQI